MFTLPDLPYGFDALEPFIDAETMQIHHDKHHAAYVKNTNEALAKLPDLLSMDPADLYLSLDKVPENIRTKVKNNLGGHINHSLFWELMAPPDDSKEPSEDSDLRKRIMEEFGGWQDFQEKFAGEAMGRFGSGWAWLVMSEDKLEIISTANQDNPILDGKKPVLGIDVWEHAYYLKYKNMRADYIKAWWNIVNWKKVEELFEGTGGDNK